jgi:hypothetical protein
MDPLTILKEFTHRNETNKIVVRKDGTVDFGGRYVFSKDSLTAWKTGNTFCTLEVVLKAQQSKGVPQAEYLKASKAVQLASLPFAERLVRACWIWGWRASLKAMPIIWPPQPDNFAFAMVRRDCWSILMASCR